MTVKTAKNRGNLLDIYNNKKIGGNKSRIVLNYETAINPDITTLSNKLATYFTVVAL